MVLPEPTILIACLQRGQYIKKTTSLKLVAARKASGYVTSGISTVFKCNGNRTSATLDAFAHCVGTALSALCFEIINVRSIWARRKTFHPAPLAPVQPAQAVAGRSAVDILFFDLETTQPLAYSIPVDIGRKQSIWPANIWTSSTPNPSITASSHCIAVRRTAKMPR